MRKIFLLLPFTLVMAASSAWAGPARIDWPERNSEVVCGGRTESGDLSFRVDKPLNILVGEASNGRVEVFIDLTKPGRAKWVMGEFWTDSDYEAREKILQKLPAKEAALMRQLSTKRISEMYTGFTSGIVHMDISFGERRLSLSCQETPKTSTP